MSNTTTTTETTTTETPEVTSMTPYAAAKVVNAALEEQGLDKRIPPQMMYNYTTARIRKGQKSFIEVDADGKITVEGLAKWMQAYITKQVALSYLVEA